MSYCKSFGIRTEGRRVWCSKHMQWRWRCINSSDPKIVSRLVLNYSDVFGLIVEHVMFNAYAVCVCYPSLKNTSDDYTGV